MPRDVEIYCLCMTELIERVRLVQLTFERTVTTGSEAFDAEIVFLQFRKILEQIAFASLAANKEAYAALREKFASEWRAKQILGYLEQVNPQFYPEPLEVHSVHKEGYRNRIHLKPLKDGFLTKADFEKLYDHCGDVLHVRNPYRSASPRIHVGRSVKDWLGRIERLVALHRTQLITGACWLGVVPDKDGKVHTYSADVLIGG